MEQQEATQGGYIVTDQEIIDAIDAEIEGSRDLDRTILAAYIEGLRFARGLIVKRMEASK